MTIIEAIRNYVATYEGLKGERLGIDFLPPDETAYSVDATPTKSEVKRYTDGSSLRQFSFTLAARAFWGPDVRQQVDNLAFFEGFEEWLRVQNAHRNFPQLGEGRTARKVEVTTSGYAFAPGTDYARYQIQCNLIYFQKGERRR